MASTSLISNELNWLITKKTHYLSELQQFESKTQQNIAHLLQLNQSLMVSSQKLADEVEAAKRTISQKDISTSEEIDGYKSLLQKGQMEKCQMKEIMEANQKLYKEAMQKLSREQKIIGEQEQKIAELERMVETKQKQKDLSILELTEKNNHNIETMILKYEQLIQQRVSAIEKQYQQELEQINIANRTMLLQLESKSKQTLQLNREEVKKNSQDTDRLIVENKKLLFHQNQSKRKLLNLETELDACKQELKIMGKEKQISAINSKREIQCLKENKQQLEQKIKKLQQSVDESRWEAKQMQIEKEKQVKKVKEESEKIIDELVISYRGEISDFKSRMKELKEQVVQSERRCEELKRQRDAALEVVEVLRKEKEANRIERAQEEKRNVKQVIQQKDEAAKLKSLNSELKKQALRKSAQVEVLKEEISRLKTKVNKITVAYQENIKAQELMQKENKMLLSEIVFLRDRRSKLMSTQKKAENNKMNSSSISNRVLDVRSQQSEILQNEDQIAELQMYRELIGEMEKDMNEAVAKLDEKNNIIEKQKAIIERLERALSK